MFQFEHKAARDEPVQTAQTPVKRDPDPRVLLSWAEHCIECAAPSCYLSCDLYDPTPLGKCRRFARGVVRTRPLVLGRSAADVQFRRWGKLEAQGNATLLSSRTANFVERLIETGAPLLERIGSVAARITRDARWRTINEALQLRLNDILRRQRRSGPVPNRLVADVVNPGAATVELRLTIAVDKTRLTKTIPTEQLPRPATVLLSLAPGHSHHDIDIADMRDLFDTGLPFLISITVADDSPARLVFGPIDLIHRAAENRDASAQPAAVKRPNAKCVIFDLDNTLWSGVLLEGDVALAAGIEQVLKTLDERGILLSIVSKNAHDDALERLRHFGIADYFLYPQIGWRPKSASIANLAKLLDIAADTFIFLDDNPFEREEVASVLPQVEVLDEHSIAKLAAHPRLQGAVTAESKVRRAMYQQAALRQNVASEYGDDYLGFLRSCGIEAEIRRDKPADFERIVELVQRTNQLNFSGRKYDREQISGILASSDQERYVVSVADRFGSYGLVGFCLVERNGRVVTVHDFMLSCRVQGKFIEQALFWYLTRDGAEELLVNFRRTERNRAAEMVLEKLGFEADGIGKLRLDTREKSLDVNFMRIQG